VAAITLALPSGNALLSQHQTVPLLTVPTTIVSVGGGQDSTAILYRLGNDHAFRERYAPGRCVAVMADTGDEHDDTLEHIERIARFCASHDIEWNYLTFDKGWHSGPWAAGLRTFYESKGAIGSVGFNPTCSDNLKIQPVYRWAAHDIATRYFDDPGLAFRKRSFYRYVDGYGEKLRVLLGIAKGEEQRIARAQDPKPCKPCNGQGLSLLRGVCRRCKGSGIAPPRSKWFVDCIERVYPLVELGWDRAACQRYIADLGEVVPPPSNCFMCHWKSPIEILWTARHDRRRFDLWVALEARKHAKHADKPVNYYVFKDRSLLDVLADAEREYGHWSDERLDAWRMSHGHCVASGF
jgi:hypothetical protein